MSGSCDGTQMRRYKSQDKNEYNGFLNETLLLPSTIETRLRWVMHVCVREYKCIMLQVFVEVSVWVGYCVLVLVLMRSLAACLSKMAPCGLQKEETVHGSIH
jgi:hypothetical protein